MSTIDGHVLPPLVEGQRLDRATFHARYEAMPPDVRAELVEGIVSRLSPLGYGHGRLDADLALWAGHYRRKTPGIRAASKATTILDDANEVQSDRLLRVPAELGGSSRIVDGFVSGPPELVIEVGLSSRSHDLGPKKRAYERAGVAEYLFVGAIPEEIRWFALRQDRYIELATDDRGIYRSEVFPGLWLDQSALFTEDLEAMIAALEIGLATPEHAAFVARLAAR